MWRNLTNGAVQSSNVEHISCAALGVAVEPDWAQTGGGRSGWNSQDDSGESKNGGDVKHVGVRCVYKEWSSESVA